MTSTYVKIEDLSAIENDIPDNALFIISEISGQQIRSKNIKFEDFKKIVSDKVSSDILSTNYVKRDEGPSSLVDKNCLSAYQLISRAPSAITCTESQYQDLESKGLLLSNYIYFIPPQTS